MATNEHVFVIGERVRMDKPSHPNHGKRGVVEKTMICPKDNCQKVKVKWTADGKICSMQYSRNFVRDKRTGRKLIQKRKDEKDRSVTYPNEEGVKEQYAIADNTATVTTATITTTTHHRLGDRNDDPAPTTFYPILTLVYMLFLNWGFVKGLQKPEGPSEKSKNTYNSQMKKENIEHFAVMVGVSNPIDITLEQINEFYNTTRGEALLKGENTHRLNSTVLKYWERFCRERKSAIQECQHWSRNTSE
jgi:hypothetical protein